ncbi:MAG: extracellular solute-binding protein [Chloroflexi bacterium]|nr:extracellular solute-binding protein [Chloroflexota bacterium]
MWRPAFVQHLSLGLIGAFAIVAVIGAACAPAAAPAPEPAKPAAPAPAPAKPVEPAAKPAQPAAKPVEPAAKPAQPAAKPAQPAAKPAQPAAKAGLDPALIEAAKKEGKISWYVSANLAIAQDTAKAFEAAYPGVKVDVVRDGAERLWIRLQQEMASNVKNADVFNTSDEGHFLELKSANKLMRFVPSTAAAFDKRFADPDGYFFAMYLDILALSYNTQKLPAADAPKKWSDLTDAKYKGKLAIAHPSYSGYIVNMMHALVGVYGWDLFEKLSKLDPMVVQSALEPNIKVVAGERLVAVPGVVHSGLEFMKKGSPLKLVFPEDGSILMQPPTAILADAPHPNAAKLFTDWLLGPEGQAVQLKWFYYSARQDITYPPDRPVLKDLKLLVPKGTDVVKERKNIQDQYKKFFGV